MSYRAKEKPRSKRRFAWLLLVLIVVAALWMITSPGVDLAFKLIRQGARAGGLGLLLIPLWLLMVLWTAKAQPRLLWRHWYRWIGTGVLMAATLGLLSLFSPAQGPFSQATYGGELGQRILGQVRGLGLVRLGLLFYLSLLLLFPTLSLRLSLLLVRGLRLIALTAAGLLLQGMVGISKVGMRVWGWRRKSQRRKPQPEMELPLHTVPPSPAAKARLELTAKENEGGQASGQPPAATRSALEKIAANLWKGYNKEKATITPSGWELPPSELLDTAPRGEWSQLDSENKARRLEEALSSYGVEAKVTQINVGPTVTQFGVEPGWDRKLRAHKVKNKEGKSETKQIEVSRTRVKVERIQALSNDLALALAASSIRIEAPVPGKSVVGIEVPNTATSVVGLRAVVESNGFLRLRSKTKLALALGQGTGGEGVVADLDKMPHLLIAGATGSGKSVCLNASICCLLLHNTPEELRLVLIDPKRVELTNYNPMPHIMGETIVDMKKAVEALSWLNLEMDHRYKQLAAAGTRNIGEYNKEHYPPMPYYILVIDELADLMMTAAEEVEHRLCRLAQLARATGIHLIVATQRPSVDVVTGLIKANFPTRISFAVASQVDSRTILDTAGAEKLLGRGDMLYLPSDAPKPLRLQGCFISDAEILRLVAFWGRQKRAEPATPWQPHTTTSPPEDPVLEAARHLAQEHKQLSASFLQRRLQIGQSRALKIMETLEQEGLLKNGKE